VLYTSEEYGGHGGRAYRDAHAAELARHVAALECDSGGFSPRGFGVQSTDDAVAFVRALGAGLAPLGPLKISAGGSGVDVAPLVEAGVPGLGHRVHGAEYFHYHHSPADTFDKIDPDALARNVAAVAALVYAIAETPTSLRSVAEAGEAARDAE
jgi:Zn-dependent M28 family amino/carboxypeptidase